MRKINISFDKEIILPRLEYVIHFLNDHPYCIGKVSFQLCVDPDKDQNLELYYGLSKGKNATFIPQQKYFFTNRYGFEKSVFLNKYHLKEKQVYSAEDKEISNTKFINDNGIQFDIFETIFFHLARVQEYFCPDSAHNEAGLIPEGELLLVKENLYKIPVVDVLIKVFLAVLKVEINQTKLTKIITHDIDLVAKYENSVSVLHSLGSTVKRSYSVTKIVRFGWDFILSKLGLKMEPYFDIRILSTSKDIKKIIYLYIGGNQKLDFPRSEKRNNYIKAWAKEARERGYILGLHPSYDAATNDDLYKEELSILEQLIDEKVEHSRQHYLHYHHNSTLPILQTNGIKFDSSFGYTRHIGFRSGTAFNHHLYDWMKECRSEIIEFPIAWMDSAMWHYSGKNAKKFMDESIKFLTNLQEGDICINIHNNSIYDYNMYGIDLLELKSKFENHG